MPAAATQLREYFATRPFTYSGQELEFGRVVTIAGQPNDEKLLRLGYFREVVGGGEPFACRECGAKFISDQARQWHGSRKHSERVLTPDQEDAAAEREDQRLQAIAPLNLDQAKGVKGETTGGKGARPIRPS